MLVNGQQSAVERCLLISEISREICGLLYKDNELEALARLARTSTNMHAAVVPVLWGHMTSFTPLLKLLQTDMGTEGPTGLVRLLSYHSPQSRFHPLTVLFSSL